VPCALSGDAQVWQAEVSVASVERASLIFQVRTSYGAVVQVIWQSKKGGADVSFQ
jgi:hypothetical protein